MRLEVNVVSGDVALLAETQVQFSGYNIYDPAQDLLSTNPPSSQQHLISATNSNWSQIESDNTAVAEGQSRTTYKSSNSATWDTITLSNQQSIDFGDIYSTLNGKRDLTFQFSEANATTGDPTTGLTYSVGVSGDDYVTPEPSGALVALMAMLTGLLVHRPKRWCPPA